MNKNHVENEVLRIPRPVSKLLLAIADIIGIPLMIAMIWVAEKMWHRVFFVSILVFLIIMAYNAIMLYFVKIEITSRSITFKNLLKTHEYTWEQIKMWGVFLNHSGRGKISHWGKKDSPCIYRSISFSEEELKKEVYLWSRIWICTEKIDNIYYDNMPVTEKFLSFGFSREALQLIQLYLPADVKVPYERDIESV